MTFETGAMIMSRIENTLDAVRAARIRASQHLLGQRDMALPESLYDQVSRFEQVLQEMEAELLSGSIPERSAMMSHAIVDGWPFESELGELIAKAEQMYLALNQ